MVVKHQRQAIGHVPDQIEAQGFVLRDGGVTTRPHSKVPGATVEFRVSRRGGVAVVAVPDRFLATKVIPGRVVAKGSLQFNLRIGVVNGRRDVVCGRPLQGQLAVGAHPIPLCELVARGLGHRVALIGVGGPILLGGQVVGNTAPLGRSRTAPAVVHVTRKAAPTADACGSGAVVALLAHGTQ